MAKDRTIISLSSSMFNHHFFKVYLPALSSHHLKIPASFISKFNGVLPEKAILKDVLERLWQVEVAKIENDFFLENGWERFVNHYCLNVGDFLVFRYHGNSVFHVRIFDKSGCESVDALEYSSFSENKNERNESEDWESFSQPCSDSEQKHSEKCGKKIGKTKSSCIIKLDEDKVLDAPCLVDPRNPHCTVTIKEQRPYDLHIPKHFVIDNDLEIKPEMILRDPRGRSWPVKAYFRKDGRLIICRGWMPFWKENMLENGDNCIFEFIKENGRTTIVINVHFVRNARMTTYK